jgi:HEAT repeat protein
MSVAVARNIAMSNVRYREAIRIFFRLAAFTFLFSVHISVAWALQTGDSVRSKVTQAVSLFPVEPVKARAQLEELGPPALPVIVDIVQTDEHSTPMKKAFLIGIIGQVRAKQADPCLIDLLSDKDPFVRGSAAFWLGKRKHKAAIPKLVDLLGDKEPYITNVRTDPYREQVIFVRDKAIEALQAIVGIALAEPGNRNAQAKAWLRWWQKRQRSK